MSYADLSGVPTQTPGVSELLASDWNTYVRDNFGSLKFGHLRVANDAERTSLGSVADEGTMVYQLDNQKLYVYNGGWVEVNDLDNAGGASDVVAASLVPTGVINPFAGSSAPSGWLLCFGQSLNATANPEYAALWGVIGTTYGGSGITSFNVPDLRGRAVAGVDNMGGSDAGRLSLANTLGTTGGSETHTLTTAELPSHSHSINHDHGAVTTSDAGAHSHTFSATRYASSAINHAASGSYNRLTWTYPTENTSAVGNHNHSVDLPNFTGTSGATGSGSAHNNMQPTMVLNYIIKV